MKKLFLIALSSNILYLASYAEDKASTSPSKEIAQWGVGVEVDEGNYYDDDDTDVEIWIGPGWYNGIWFDNEVEFDDWHHHHHHHGHHGRHGHHDHHDHHDGHHGGHHGDGHHGGSHHGGGHGGGHHK